MAVTWCRSGRAQPLRRLATLVPPRRTTTASAARHLRAGLVLAQSGCLRSCLESLAREQDRLVLTFVCLFLRRISS